MPNFKDTKHKSPQRLGCIFQIICNGWYAFARNLGFKGVQQMLRPYMCISLDPFRYDILRFRDMAYMPKETATVLSPRHCVPVFEEASTFPNVTKFRDHVHTLLRLWAYKFLSNIRTYAYTNAAYQSSTYNPKG